MTLISSLTKLGSVQNNSISKSQINSLSGATSSQSSNSVASHNPDVHVLIVGNILGIPLFVHADVDL
ncbi:hypothetical protein PPL_08579 [Heterostelium album PN500]|uniref:Uncharacterized protein n=1 Tax=Heterostelium pallidum (strain ATCC 26659 / Pp 5 / PN500) TaxID=670386 RepID=D3BJ54_HETP5|nr:hypothetical protein PPL_08579 [Heterostelium album PN500]EFA77934.1 hypothetical protein PPL_08579 [Heterostelium album PN500]|eukprot:XP_020430062.1 hypothetical protein PPL_08579 [Heterostelium album PN500]